MKLRNGKIIENVPVSFFEKLNKYDNFIRKIQRERFDIDCFFHTDDIRTINLLYMLFLDKFEQLHKAIIKSDKNKKEDLFIEVITKLSTNSQILMKELKKSKINRTNIMYLIKLTDEKIKNYIKTYKKNKNNVFVELSSKIGSNIVQYINSYMARQIM